MAAIHLERHFDQRVVPCLTERPPDFTHMWQAAAQRRPQAEALVCGDLRLDWASFETQVRSVAAGLQTRGVKAGDRVALLLFDSAECVVAICATLAIGAIAVPLSVREQTPGLRYILQHCGASVLLVDAQLHSLIPQAEDTPALQHCLVVNSAVQTPDTFEALCAHAPLLQCATVNEEDVAILLYTSGTTGTPKGAMLTHLNVVHSILHYAQVMGLDENVRTAMSVPLSHVTGLVALASVALGLGGTLVIMPPFKADSFLEIMARERIHATIMVPAMYKLCLLQDNLQRYNLSAWRVGGYGGAPMPPETIDKLAQWLPGLGLYNCYGATETTSPAAIMPAALTRAHPDSVGLPVPCGEIIAMDAQGREVPAGEVGELWIKGAMVVPGYWNNPQASADQFVDGYWRSGDLGRVDAQGYVYVLDRQKDMLNRGGYKIYSIEVENTLSEHPDVVEAAIVAKPCPVLGERVHAFVGIRAGGTADADTLRDFCHQRLSDYKVPETFTLRTDPLPRNANGKLLKRALREELLSTLDGQTTSGEKT